MENNVRMLYEEPGGRVLLCSVCCPLVAGSRCSAEPSPIALDARIKCVSALKAFRNVRGPVSSLAVLEWLHGDDNGRNRDAMVTSLRDRAQS